MRIGRSEEKIAISVDRLDRSLDRTRGARRTRRTVAKGDVCQCVAAQYAKEHNCVPVYIEDNIADEHYNGFSNAVLWPLFHYLLEECGTSYSVWRLFS
jgi:trehalose-6-phosphate synthase